MKGFRHTTRLRVRNYEVDWQGIVHNSIYLQYFEVGRMEYLRRVGHLLDLTLVNRQSRVVLARNEINYVSPARFDNQLEIGTKISTVGTSSFVFEGFIRICSINTLVATNRAVHVWLHPKGGHPVPVPRSFLKKVETFERREIPRKIADL